MKPIRNPSVKLQSIGDESILYMAEHNAIHVLNSTARTIWEQCDGVHSLEDIEANLRDIFSVSDLHNLKSDIQQTLDVLASKNLITYLGNENPESIETG